MVSRFGPADEREVGGGGADCVGKISKGTVLRRLPRKKPSIELRGGWLGGGWRTRCLGGAAGNTTQIQHNRGPMNSKGGWVLKGGVG